MVAIKGRMAAGFPGDVNRAHPFSVTPVIPLNGNPPTAYGQPVVADASGNGVRPFGAGDGAVTDMWGVTVRPYPLNPANASNYGQVSLTDVPVPPTNQIMDVLQSGFIFVPVVGTPVQGGRVYIWYAATSGSNVQSGFQASNTGGSTLQLNDRYYFNGGPDVNGVCELRCNA